MGKLNPTHRKKKSRPGVPRIGKSVKLREEKPQYLAYLQPQHGKHKRRKKLKVIKRW